MSTSSYHQPAMLAESLEALQLRADGIYIDATYGGGGHSRAILDRLDHGQLYAFDQDPQARRELPDHPGFHFIESNFRYMRNFLKMHGIEKADGILADLGVSSHQFDSPERGFSIRFEGPLDMRMAPQNTLSAARIVNTYDETALAEIFRLYGEVPQAARLAHTIATHREHNPIETTARLREIIMPLAPKKRENKFLAQVFQALRIEVNQELDALREFLAQCSDCLKPGGRLVVISYHSLEDRLVKYYMRAGNFSGEIIKDFYGHPITPFRPAGKALSPASDETALNPRVRSARLRVAIRQLMPEEKKYVS